MRQYNHRGNTCTVPEIRFLKSPDKLVRTSPKLLRNYGIFGLTFIEIILSLLSLCLDILSEQIDFGQTTAKNDRKLSDVRL